MLPVRVQEPPSGDRPRRLLPVAFGVFLLEVGVAEQTIGSIPTIGSIFCLFVSVFEKQGLGL